MAILAFELMLMYSSSVSGDLMSGATNFFHSQDIFLLDSGVFLNVP